MIKCLTKITYHRQKVIKQYYSAIFIKKFVLSVRLRQTFKFIGVSFPEIKIL